MTDEENADPRESAFGHLHRVGIGHLSPDAESTTASFVDGDVALIWPFSSITGELSILLAEPDVRLRKSKGQVKITFRNACARKVAASRLGIGDNVRLSLEGAEWVNTGEAVSTPGKKIEWDLCYGRRAILEISRGSVQLAFINFEQQPQEETRNGVNGVPKELITPYASKSHGTPSNALPLSFSSPAFSVSKRRSAGSFIDASLDPFAEDDGFVVGKGRKRTKFARHSGSWKLLDDSAGERGHVDLNGPEERIEELEVVETLSDSSLDESPEIEVVNQNRSLLGQINGLSYPILRSLSHAGYVPQEDRTQPESVEISSSASSEKEIEGEVESETKDDIEEEIVEDIDDELEDQSGQEAEEEVEIVMTDPKEDEIASGDKFTMAPPITPLRHRPPWQMVRSEDSEPEPTEPPQSQATTTPRLHPLPSPGLPLVSPLIQRAGVATGYFPDVSTASSELEASGVESPTNLGEALDSKASDFKLAMPSISAGGYTSRDAETSSIEQPDRGFELVNVESPLEGGPIGDTPLAQMVEDEDMYGSSEPPTEIDHNRRTAAHLQPEVPQPLAEQHPRLEAVGMPPPAATYESSNWPDKVDITAVDSETLRSMSSPPFPFVQGWERSSNRSRRSSTYPRSLDGASDHMDQDEVLSHASGPETAPAPSHSVADHVERIRRIGETAHSPHEDERDMQGPILSPNAKSYNFTPDAIADQEVLELVSSDTEAVEKPTGTLTEEHDLRIQPSTKQQPRLLTPANTQPDVLDDIESTITRQQEEPQMPPTPQNTQEQVGFPLPESSLETVEAGAAKTEIVGSATPVVRESSPGNRRTSQRLSRKSLPFENISILSSPYFTPRRPVRMQPQLPSPTRKENLPLPDEISAPLSPQKVETIGTKKIPDIENPPAESTPALVHRPSGLTTPLSYFTPLATVSDHFFQSIDVIAVCPKASTEPLRAKSGPKDFHCTVQLTDPSLKGGDIVLTQMFRPSKHALPTTKRGDVVLLRNVKVQSQKRKCVLLSTEVSAWAVFSHPVHAYSSASLLGAKNAGPPVEYGREECSRAIELMQWWDEEGSKRFPLPEEDNGAKTGHSTVAEGEPPSGAEKLPAATQSKGHKAEALETKPQPSAVLQELPRTRSGNRRQGNLTDHFGNGEDYHPASPELPSPPATRRRSDASLVLQPPPRTRRGHRRDRKSETIIHELRDGTTWTDDQQPSSPRTRRTLRSESVLHELRDGTTWVDEEQPTSPISRKSQRSESFVHELRDGTKWADEEQQPSSPINRKSRRSVSLVHELRDGTRWVDTEPPTSPTSRRSRRSESVLHELRDGATYVDE